MLPKALKVAQSGHTGGAPVVVIFGGFGPPRSSEWKFIKIWLNFDAEMKTGGRSDQCDQMVYKRKLEIIFKLHLLLQ